MDAATLFLNNLYNLVHTEEEIINLRHFLNELTLYCSEYYSDLRLSLIVEDESPINFYSKQAFLIEAIFNILSTITRIGKFSTDDIITLRATKVHNNELPSFSVEVLPADTLKPLGWEAGLSYTCSGLLAIHALAKENNYFFFIAQENDKIVFKLEPYDKQKLTIADNLCKKCVNLGAFKS